MEYLLSTGTLRSGHSVALRPNPGTNRFNDFVTMNVRPGTVYFKRVYVVVCFHLTPRCNSVFTSRVSIYVYLSSYMILWVLVLLYKSKQWVD